MMLPVLPPDLVPTFFAGLLTGFLVAERVVRWRDRRALIWRRVGG